MLGNIYFPEEFPEFPQVLVWGHSETEQTKFNDFDRVFLSSFFFLCPFLSINFSSVSEPRHSGCLDHPMPSLAPPRPGGRQMLRAQGGALPQHKYYIQVNDADEPYFEDSDTQVSQTSKPKICMETLGSFPLFLPSPCPLPLTLRETNPVHTLHRCVSAPI